MRAASYYDDQSTWRIGLNYVTSVDGSARWYTLSHVLASALLTGRAPKVVRALRVVPIGIQRGLRRASVRGSVAIDPQKDRIYKRLVEERQRVKGSGDLGSVQLQAALKLLANSTAYGSTMEFNRNDLVKPQQVDVWGQTRYTSEATAVEKPGTFCNPLIGTMVSSGAWLILAMIERFIRDRGAAYAFCDTDSMAIIEEGQTIARDLAQKFESLTPYGFGGSLIKVERENFSIDASDRPEQLHFLGISAKRYVLFNLCDGVPVIRKASEHGIGHLLPPGGKARFIEEWWQLILARQLGLDSPEPSWLDLPAVGRLAISQPALWRPFRKSTDRRLRQVTPFSFMLVAYPVRGHNGVGGSVLRPVAPYEKKPARWTRLPWIDLATGARLQLDFGPEHSYSSRRVPVKTLRHVLGEYMTHPESTAAGPSGDPCSRTDSGQLERLHIGISAATTHHIGKESHELDVAEVLGVADEEMLDYKPGLAVLLEALSGLSDSEIARSAGISRQQVHNLKSGMTRRARHSTLDRLREVL